MPAQRKYPDELRERAVRMVLEIRQRDGKGQGELARVGRQLGVHPEALRGWVKQAEIDSGTRPGTTTEDQQRIAELERENRGPPRDLGGSDPGGMQSHACTAEIP
jgi:transposase